MCFVSFKRGEGSEYETIALSCAPSWTTSRAVNNARYQTLNNARCRTLNNARNPTNHQTNSLTYHQTTNLTHYPTTTQPNQRTHLFTLCTMFARASRARRKLALFLELRQVPGAGLCRAGAKAPMSALCDQLCRQLIPRTGRPPVLCPSVSCKITHTKVRRAITPP
jgi:hypothetical protein